VSFPRVGGRKIWVEFDGILEKWERRRRAGIKKNFMPELKAFRASSEGVVAWASGVSNFCTLPSDSPSFPRMSEAVFPSASST
jgi:hypothetical protein